MGSQCPPSTMNTRVLTLLSAAVVLCLCPTPSNAQFGFLNDLFRPVMNFFRPFTSGVRQVFFGPSTINSLRSEGRDQLFPADCGRDEKNKGKLCFGDPDLCKVRTQMDGIHQFNGRNYWFSWQDSNARVRNTKWDWFNARNYCRKRCMDLVSFETREEYEWVKGFINVNVPYFWTSGRLCDFDGCDRPDFFPKNINGWFWSSNQARLAPTDSRTAFHDWSGTGGFNPPRAQPDNREQVQQRGESESCLAVLNNFYGDGIKWHDVACHHEKPIICEDVEGHLAFARQTFPNIRIP